MLSHVVARGQPFEPRLLREQDTRSTKEGLRDACARQDHVMECRDSILLSDGDSMPSIAQLEERGTVKETLCDPKVTGSTPVRRIFWPAAINDDTPTGEVTRRDVFHLIPYLYFTTLHQTTSLMADVQPATQDDRQLFTCLSCSIAFLTAEEQRTSRFYSRTQIELMASRGSLSLRPP